MANLTEVTLLRELRGGRSQQEVCEATGLNHRTLVHYEEARGKRRPNAAVIAKLADYYHVRLSIVLDDLERVQRVRRAREAREAREAIEQAA